MPGAGEGRLAVLAGLSDSNRRLKASLDDTVVNKHVYRSAA